jgi:hypothetical protein
LIERAAKLRGLPLASEFFFEGPAVVVADEDAAAIAVEGGGHTAAAQQAVQQVKVAFGRFGEEEAGGEDFAGSIVLHAQSGETRAAAFQPVVRRAVQLHEFAFAGGAQSALAMSGGTAGARRTDAGGAQQSAKGFAAERETFFLDELLLKMMVVEAGVASTGEREDVSPHGPRQAAMAGPAAAGVSQSRCAALPVARFEAFDMPRR